MMTSRPINLLKPNSPIH